MATEAQRQASRDRLRARNATQNAKQQKQISDSKQNISQNRGSNSKQTGNQVGRGSTPDTIHNPVAQAKAGRHISVQLFESLSLSDKAKVSVARNVHLQEQIKINDHQNSGVKKRAIIERAKVESKKANVFVSQAIKKEQNSILAQKKAEANARITNIQNNINNLSKKPTAINHTKIEFRTSARTQYRKQLARIPGEQAKLKSAQEDLAKLNDLDPSTLSNSNVTSLRNESKSQSIIDKKNKTNEVKATFGNKKKGPNVFKTGARTQQQKQNTQERNNTIQQQEIVGSNIFTGNSNGQGQANNNPDLPLSVLGGNSFTTIQKQHEIKVHKIRLYEDDTRSVQEQMKNPITDVFGPYVQTESDAKTINDNRQKSADDKKRNSLTTLTSLTPLLGQIPGVRDFTKAFDKEFELNKLPKEQSSERKLKSNLIPHGLLPSNQALSGFFATASNAVADIDDLGKSLSEHISTGGKSGFIKNDSFFGVQAKQHNPKKDTALNQALSGKPVDWDNTSIKASAFGDVGIGAVMVALGGVGAGKVPTTPKGNLGGITSTLKPETVGSTKFIQKSLLERLSTKVKGKTGIEKGIDADLKISQERFSNLSPNQIASNFQTRNKLAQKLKRDTLPKYYDLNYLNFNTKSLFVMPKSFTSEIQGLGNGFGLVIPKNPSHTGFKPTKSDTTKTTFDTLGINKKGGSIVKPKFDDIKITGNNNINQIFKEKINIKTLEQSNIKLKDVSKTQSTVNDIIHKTPKRGNTKSKDSLEFEYIRVNQIQKNKPIITTTNKNFNLSVALSKTGAMLGALGVGSKLKVNADVRFTPHSTVKEKEDFKFITPQKIGFSLAPQITNKPPSFIPESFVPPPFNPQTFNSFTPPPERHPQRRIPLGGLRTYFSPGGRGTFTGQTKGSGRRRYITTAISSDINQKILKGPFLRVSSRPTKLFRALDKLDNDTKKKTKNTFLWGGRVKVDKKGKAKDKKIEKKLPIVFGNSFKALGL